MVLFAPMALRFESLGRNIAQRCSSYRLGREEMQAEPHFLTLRWLRNIAAKSPRDDLCRLRLIHLLPCILPTSIGPPCGSHDEQSIKGI